MAISDATGDYGAVIVSGLGYRIARGRGIPVLAPRLEIPARRDLDARLVGGAMLFGIGWGLVGLCPGPALVGLTFGPVGIFAFVAAMIAGMVLFRVLPSRWPRVTFRRAASGLDG